MPTIVLNQTACTSGLSTGWASIGDTERITFENAVAPELAGPGVLITQIQIIGRVRNSATAVKQLQLGFKPALASPRNTWSTLDGQPVVDAAFVAIAASPVAGSYRYANVARTYSASLNAPVFERFAKHLQQCFSQQTPAYLSLIQPASSREISVYVNGYWKIYITYELLGNVPLPQQTSVELGNSLTTNIQTVIEASSTTLRYKMGDALLAQYDLGTSSSHTYTVPQSAGAHFPQARTGTLSVEAETFLDGVSYGVVRATVSLALPEDAAPTSNTTLSRIWVDGVSQQGKIAAYVQSKSGANFAISATARYGATVASIRLAVEGKTYSGATASHLPFVSSGAVSYAVTVTDSRGLSATQTGNVQVLAYQPPRVKAFSVSRVNEEGAPAVDGTYALAKVQLEASSLLVDGQEKNSLRYAVGYREILSGEEQPAWTDGDAFSSAAISIDRSAQIQKDGEAVGGGGTDSTGANLPFNDMAGYAFHLQASDLYSTSTAGDQMPTKEQVFDLNPDTCKIGFGGDAPGAQEEAAFRFHKPVEFSGGVLGLGEYALEETDTGRRFLDGRKIYARTFLSYLTASALTPMGKIDDLGETVYLEGVVRIDDGSVLPFNLYYSSSSYCYAQVLQNGVVSGYSRYAVAMRLTVYYTRASQAATRYALPALNANSEQGCQVSASSTYSALYPVYRAFDGNLSTHWATQATDAQPWVQVMFPQALKNLVVRLTDTSLAAEGGHTPTSGAFLGSVDGNAWVELGTFSNRPDAVANNATRHELHNATAYKYLRVKMDRNASSAWMGFSDIRVEGEIEAEEASA